MNNTKTQENFDICFCNNGLFDNDITAMEKKLQKKIHLQQFEINSILQSAYTHDGNICVLVDWIGDYEPSWELLQNIKTNVENMFEHMVHSHIPVMLREIKSISQRIKKKDGQQHVFVDWVGDYEPSWELLENMPISIRNLGKNNNVNESAAFKDAVDPKLENTELGQPFVLDSFLRQDMDNKYMTSEYYGDFDNRHDVPFTSINAAHLNYVYPSEKSRQAAMPSKKETQPQLQQQCPQGIKFQQPHLQQFQQPHLQQFQQPHLQQFQQPHLQQLQQPHLQAYTQQFQQPYTQQFQQPHLQQLPQPHLQQFPQPHLQQFQQPYTQQQYPYSYPHLQPILLQGQMLGPVHARQIR